MTYPALLSFAGKLAAACLGLSVFGLTACVATDASQDGEESAELEGIDTSRACFTQREIRGYAPAPDGPAGRERIYLRTGVRERFVLETFGGCPDLDFSHRIALETRTMGSVCTGDVERLVIASAIPQEFGQCPVRVLGRLIEE